MTKETNATAADFWSQIFATLANDPAAAMNDPEHDATQDEARMREGMAAAGWSPAEVEAIAQSKRKARNRRPAPVLASTRRWKRNTRWARCGKRSSPKPL
jgi:hypothetical protein